MHTDNNNQTGLDEIVFESRNKEYGAYYLRKEYNKNTSKAVVFGLICLLLSAGTPFIMANFNKNGKTIIEDNPITFIDLKTEADELPPPPPPPPTPPPIENQAKFTTPLVVDDPVDSVEMGTNDQIKQNTRNDAVNIDIKDDKTKIEIIDIKWKKLKYFLLLKKCLNFREEKQN
jgi:periplasmic protein TonB